MARFYFDLHECGTVLEDMDGMEADDVEAARAIAVTAARDVMCGEVSTGELCLSCFIQIRDDETHVVGRVMFREAVRVSGMT